MGPTRQAVGIGRPVVGKAGDLDAFLSHAFSNYAQRAKARPVPVSAGVR
jgi:hypothetical protein